MKQKMIVAIVSCMVTLVGNYVLQRVIQEKAKPVLVKDVYRTDLSGLPPDIQRQIPLIPIRYSLRHDSGATAKNVTILIKSDSILSISDLSFTSDSEDHQCGQVDPHTFKIHIPGIRPSGVVSFQLITAVANTINFSELAETGRIVAAADLQAQKKKTSVIEMGAIACGIVLWLALIIGVGVLIWRIGKWWQQKEDDVTPAEMKKKVILLITALFIYRVVTNSAGPFSAWLPVPRISFSELIDAFLLYLLLTRYKVVENWFLAKKERDSAPTKPGNSGDITRIT
jgi:hypothetical protein